jgi:excisionase family DNA binding protein
LSEPVPDRLLDAAEVAAMLGVPVRWVRDATRDGRLPCVKLGRYRRYRREALITWVQAQEAGGDGARVRIRGTK